MVVMGGSNPRLPLNSPAPVGGGGGGARRPHPHNPSTSDPPPLVIGPMFPPSEYFCAVWRVWLIVPSIRCYSPSFSCSFWGFILSLWLTDFERKTPWHPPPPPFGVASNDANPFCFRIRFWGRIFDLPRAAGVMFPLGCLRSPQKAGVMPLFGDPCKSDGGALGGWFSTAVPSRWRAPPVPPVPPPAILQRSENPP